MFLQVCVCPQGGHAWWPGGCAWLPGACVVARGRVWLLGGHVSSFRKLNCAMVYQKKVKPTVLRRAVYDIR